MKIEIEIGEEQMRAELQKHVGNALRSFLSDYETEQHIRNAVRAQAMLVIDVNIAECVKDEPEIREKVRAAMTRRIQAQFNAITKGATK
jgi:hypothetical protein